MQKFTNKTEEEEEQEKKKKISKTCVLRYDYARRSQSWINFLLFAVFLRLQQCVVYLYIRLHRNTEGRKASTRRRRCRQGSRCRAPAASQRTGQPKIYETNFCASTYLAEEIEPECAKLENSAPTPTTVSHFYRRVNGLEWSHADSNHRPHLRRDCSQKRESRGNHHQPLD